MRAAVAEGEPESRRGGAFAWRGWSGVLKISVSVLAGWLLWIQVEDPAELLEALLRVEPAIVGFAVLLYLVGQVLTAYRWQVIAAKVGFSSSFSEITRFYFIGMFFNLFGPSTLGGDVVRSLYLGRTDGRRAVALNTVIFDRLSGLGMLVVVAVVAMLFFGSFNLPAWVVYLSWSLGILMVAGWWLVPAVTRFTLADGNRVRTLVEEELAPFWYDAALLFKAAWVSVGFHVLQILTLVLLGSALGLELPWQYYFVFHPLVTIFSALPISVAGLGIREMGYLWFLARSQVPSELSVAFGLLWLTVLLASSAAGGLVFLWDDSGLPSLRGREGFHGSG
ncbi:MAG: YbhN family protein [Candidatus Binatia bacterium]